MFNDIEKKLMLTAPLNFVLGLLYCFMTGSLIKVVTEYNHKGEPVAFLPQSSVKTFAVILAAVVVVVSALSLWLALAIKNQKTKPFNFLKGGAKFLRALAWILVVVGGLGMIVYEYWTFFNVISDNAVINAVTYAVASLVPAVAMLYSFAVFLYGLGNAADNGGDANYVKESKLFDMEPLHDQNDTRKICPDCGTRTDRKTCPNCGATVK